MNDMSFESAMEELESIVKRLETGSGTLDESLSDFERATALVKFCNEQLTAAEKKIEILTGGDDE